MDDMFSALKKAMFDYNNVDRLTPLKRERVISTYAKYANNYDVVDALLDDAMSEEKDEEE